MRSLSKDFKKIDGKDWWSLLEWLRSVDPKSPSEGLLDILVGLLEHENKYVRLAAVGIFASWGGGGAKAAQGLSKRLTTDENEEIKQLALQGLFGLGAAAIPALLDRLDEHDRNLGTSRLESSLLYSFFLEPRPSYLPAILEALERPSITGQSLHTLRASLERLGLGAREGEGKISSAAPSLPLQGGVTFSPEDWGPNEDTEVEEEERQEGSASLLRLPLNPNDVRFEIRPMSVDLLLARMKNQEILLQPEFQRKSVWTSVQKSLLIESMMLRIPIPAFYIDASDPEKWKVIDGQQRLTALREFLLADLQESLAFEGLEFFVEYNGKRRDALPRHLHRRLLESQVTVYTVETRMEPSLSFHVFKRINTGGLPLSSQEIRHALYQGHATKLLESLSQDSFFKKTASLTDERMEARELLLQALSFRLTAPWLAPPQIDDRLNQAMLRLNGCSAKEIQSLQSDFCRAFELSFELLGSHAYRKPHSIEISFVHSGSHAYRKPSVRRLLPLNKTLFETIVPCFSFLTFEQGKTLLDKKEAFLKHWTELFEQPPEKGKDLFDRTRFWDSISKGSRNPLALFARFRILESLVQEIIPEVSFWKEEKGLQSREACRFYFGGEDQD